MPGENVKFGFLVNDNTANTLISIYSQLNAEFWVSLFKVMVFPLLVKVGGDNQVQQLKLKDGVVTEQNSHLLCWQGFHRAQCQL